MIVATIVGNVTNTPVIRRTRSGDLVASFGVACNNSQKDQQGNWQSVGTMFVQVAAFGGLGEHVAQTLNKGAEVIVQGYIGAREYQDRNGDNRTSYDMTARAIGPSLRWDAYQPIPRQQGNAGGAYGNQQNGGFENQPPANTGGFGANQQASNQQQGWNQDPWNSQPPQTPQNENPPF